MRFDGMGYDAEHRWLIVTERLGTNHGASAIVAENVGPEFADAVIAVFDGLPAERPKDDWECQTAGCYLAGGHAGEHEPGMCECGHDMDAHSGGWVLLHHDGFMASKPVEVLA